MSVRKRRWITAKGENKESWIVDYVDQLGKRHIQTFERKKKADDHWATVKVDVRKGIHVAHSGSITVAEAADLWLAWADRQNLTSGTTDHYEQHVRLHIKPRIGHEKLSSMTTPRVEKFKDQLVAELSPGMPGKVLTSFKAILREARRLGKIVHNPAEGVTIKKNQRKDKKRKLKAGVDFPTLEEAKSVLNTAKGKQRAVLMVAALIGPRASEIRGLQWKHTDLKKRKLTIDQRADEHNRLGLPKSETSERVVPFGEDVAKALTEWKVQSEFKKPDDFVFPTQAGDVSSYDQIADPLKPIFIAAGVTTGSGDERKAKYTLHKLRHFYASWCISRGLQAKVISERMGHASITITMDLYGHLFEDDENYKEIDAAEQALLAQK